MILNELNPLIMELPLSWDELNLSDDTPNVSDLLDAEAKKRNLTTREFINKHVNKGILEERIKQEQLKIIRALKKSYLEDGLESVHELNRKSFVGSPLIKKPVVEEM